MPDISKCVDNNCPLKDKCWRYTSEASIRQQYEAFKYNNGCDYFIDNKDND